MRRHTIRVTCLAGVIGILAGASAAGATPGSMSFQESHPVASTLCAKVAAGHASAKLESQKTAVEQACSLLMSSYATAQGTVTNEYNAYQQNRQNAINTREAACTPPHRGHAAKAACHAARAAFRATMVQLHGTYNTALTQFRTSVQSGRTAFWATIGSLRHP
jgi:hypothetical protein